ncbi:hypothetical protein SAMN05660816_05228 [Niastella yeongjuensis]|nr:hypothetical protein SAMN05660816_05228 [Niastella yeongjuensis]
MFSVLCSSAKRYHPPPIGRGLAGSAIDVQHRLPRWRQPREEVYWLTSVGCIGFPAYSLGLFRLAAYCPSSHCPLPISHCPLPFFNSTPNYLPLPPHKNTASPYTTTIHYSTLFEHILPLCLLIYRSLKCYCRLNALLNFK